MTTSTVVVDAPLGTRRRNARWLVLANHHHMGIILTVGAWARNLIETMVAAQIGGDCLSMQMVRIDAAVVVAEVTDLLSFCSQVTIGHAKHQVV